MCPTVVKAVTLGCGNNIQCYTTEGRNMGIKGSKKAPSPNSPPVIFRGGISPEVRGGDNIISAKRRLPYGLLFLGGFAPPSIMTQFIEGVGRFFRRNKGPQKITQKLKNNTQSKTYLVSKHRGNNTVEHSELSIPAGKAEIRPISGATIPPTGRNIIERMGEVGRKPTHSERYA